MPLGTPAKLLRVHLCEGDRYRDKPLYEAIVAKCRELKIAGATVFRGLEGYGNTAEIHRHHLVSRDQPIVIQIVDTAENIQRVLPVIEDMMDKGLLAMSDVEVVRVSKSGPA
jgi:PII-like signaling protein